MTASLVVVGLNKIVTGLYSGISPNRPTPPVQLIINSSKYYTQERACSDACHSWFEFDDEVIANSWAGAVFPQDFTDPATTGY